MFENKKIVVLGMAKSGYEVAKLLSKHNNEIIVNDVNEDQDDQKVKELEGLGVRVILGSHPEELINKEVDCLVKNPGVPESHEYVRKCRELNIKVVNEYEVAYAFLPKDITIIGITGTNGKTTTTTLIYEIIKKSSYRVHLTGNVGYPLSGMVDVIKSGDVVVIEVAGHQLVNTDKFKTNIGVFLNLYEAHLDFHGNFENYGNIKKRIFNHHTEKDYAVINYDNEFTREKTKDIRSNKLYFSFKSPQDAYYENGNIYLNNELFVNENMISLVGRHNYENVMAAILVCNILKIDKDIITSALKEFKGIEHRIEFVKRVGNTSFYNDSKSTNCTSTITALNSFDKKDIVLILGGLDRNLGFDELVPFMNNVICVVGYGETKNKIKDFAASINKKSIITDNLGEAVLEAFNYNKMEKIVLLSPACASWDQFKNFEERGNSFKECVNNLK